MTEHPVPSLLAGDRTGQSTNTTRITSALFAAALLAFLLPFATVSCGEPVTFTGVELATAGVADDTPTADQREFGDEIESNGTVLTLIALVAAAVGLGLAAAQIRGAGPAALVGLLPLLLLPWVAAGSLADFVVDVGYVLAVATLTGVLGLGRVSAVARRRSAGRRRWPAVLAGLVLAVPIVATMLLCAWASSVW